MKRLPACGLAAVLLAGCASAPAPAPSPRSTAPAHAQPAPAAPARIAMAGDPQATCAALAGKGIPASAIGFPGGNASIESAQWLAATPLAVTRDARTPAAGIRPPLPPRCRVLGRIGGIDAAAPFIHFQVNLPAQWNGRSVQYGGGGFNGTLVTGEALLPAARFEQPAPLAQGYVTYGTDSGHQTGSGEAPQAFALNSEAMLNFAHASYKKVRDVAVILMRTVYGRSPEKLYFVGSSEGGREGLAMAQRYPKDFDGILSRAPVIQWTGLFHSFVRNGLALQGEGWLPPAKVKLVHEAVLAACDAADGATDRIVADPVACRSRFDVAKLRCPGAAADDCLGEAQVRAVQAIYAPLALDVELANGLRSYPGRGPGAEDVPASGSAGGWVAWWTGTTPPAVPPARTNGIGWNYGVGALRYIFARSPNVDPARYRAAEHAQRVREVSDLMDAANPDLSAFREHGGRIILLENLGDYAQSPYAGIEYHDAVVRRMGRDTVAGFFRLYTAPGVDHVGTGAPGNADLFPALVAWVEQGRAPAGLELVEQEARPPFAVKRSRPLCEWPLVPRYRGGNIDAAASFACAP